jgi:PKD repeat protein
VSIPTGFTPEPIATGQPEGNLTNFEFLPDDRVRMWPSRRGTRGNLIRLRYSAGNRAPVAQAVTTVDPATLTVTFDRSTSYDLDSDNLTYTWDFGDGGQGTGAVATHTYAAAGKVTADPGDKPIPRPLGSLK